MVAPPRRMGQPAWSEFPVAVSTKDTANSSELGARNVRERLTLGLIAPSVCYRSLDIAAIF